MNPRSLRAMSIAVALAGASVFGVSGVANAAAESSSDSIASALQAHHLLDSPSDASTAKTSTATDTDAAASSSHVPTGSLNADTGLTVAGSAADQAVQIKPVTDLPAIRQGKALTYSNGQSFGFALTGQGTAANAGYAVINNAAAPTDYSFDLTAGGMPATLALDNGIVSVKNASGQVVNLIKPAWALDANGNKVATSYTVNGHVLTQHVEHAGAAYPVVADPGLACDALFCTYMYDAGQTATIANYGSVGAGLTAAGCAAIGSVIAGALCEAYGSWIVGAASQAKDQGQCVGIRHFNYSGGFIFPVIENC